MADLTELEKIQLETARLNLEEAKETNKQRVARKKQIERDNATRQLQLRSSTEAMRKLRDEQCTHRQGGSPAKPKEGKGKSALTVSRMPDGWTKMIKCLVCRGEWNTPHPYNMRTDSFPVGFHMPGGVVLEKKETKEQIEARVERYRADKKRFDEMMEHAQDKLTPEATQEMDCGTVHTLTNSETGVTVYPWRPCDSSALAQAVAA